MSKKECNCKKDTKRLIQTIEDINKTKNKGYKISRSFVNKLLINIIKYGLYSILIILFIILLKPIIITIFVMNIILKKQIKLKLPFKKLYH